MNSCTQQTLHNPYVVLLIRYWYVAVIAVMALWIIKRGVR